MINLNDISRLVNYPKPNYKSVQIDFLCFNKLEYYTKNDNIEK